MKKFNAFKSEKGILANPHPVLVIQFTKTQIEPNANGENCIVNGYVSLCEAEDKDYLPADLICVSANKFERLIKDDNKWIHSPIREVGEKAISNKNYLPENAWYSSDNSGVVIDLVKYSLKDEYVIPLDQHQQILDGLNAYGKEIGKEFNKAYDLDKLAEEVFKKLEAILDK